MDLENNEFLQFAKCAQFEKLDYMIIGGGYVFEWLKQGYKRCRYLDKANT